VSKSLAGRGGGGGGGAGVKKKGDKGVRSLVYSQDKVFQNKMGSYGLVSEGSIPGISPCVPLLSPWRPILEAETERRFHT